MLELDNDLDYGFEYLSTGRFDELRHRDMDIIARHMYDTQRWYGTAVLIRRKFLLEDWEGGEVPRCSCYNPNYGQAASSHCPLCFGTGFMQGYHEPELTYITMSGNIGHDEKKDKQGERESQDQHSISMMSDRIYHDGDVIARISEYDGGAVTGLSEFWEIDGPVARQEEWGLWAKEYDTESRLVSMTARVKVLLPTDPRSDWSFWGIGGSE